MTGSLVGAALLAVVVGGLSEATYADDTVYLLNTEESLAAEVAVRRTCRR